MKIFRLGNVFLIGFKLMSKVTRSWSLIPGTTARFWIIASLWQDKVQDFLLISFLEGGGLVPSVGDHVSQIIVTVFLQGIKEQM